jgi:adenylosuccinate synthase
MTKADVLSGFGKIKVCTAYKINGEITDQIPFEHDARIEPVYTEIESWDEDISAIREYDKLPSQLRSYIGYLETATGVPVTMVSVGPDRKETIFRK